MIGGFSLRKLAAILPLLLAACVTTRQPDATAEVFIRVDGMTRVQGIT
ncbi:MAG: hypothetical protein M5U25_02915 [Planctomycetota bacterium]|nr:hypothetical protein [Planctomycetota bacterium]